ncbi:MAG: hypothetical protein ACJAZ9_000486 [Neolewinella sp.]|jgi:hypothetical protein
MRRLILSLLFILLGTSFVSACGYYLFGEDYRIALFNPYIIGEEYSPFFYSSDQLNHWENGINSRDRNANVDAWAKELGGKVTGEDVMAILYGSNVDGWVAARDKTSDQGFAGNPAWEAIKKRPDLLEYALYAKGYETNNIQRNWWDDEEEEEPSPYKVNFKERAEAGYQKAAEGSFLKERYGYQLLLLARYERDKATATTYFDRHFQNKQGPLAGWASFHLASLDYNDQRYLVEMANAFRRVPEKAIAIYVNTYSRDTGAYNPYRLLDITLSDEERSNLFALAALQQKGYALEYLELAHEYDPSNPVIDLLLVREMNKLEDWLMTHELTHLSPALSSQVGGGWYWGNEWEEKKMNLRKKNYKLDRAHLTDFRNFLDGYEHKDENFTRLLKAQAALLDEDYYKAMLYSKNLDLEEGAIGMQAKVLRYLAMVQQQGISQQEKNEYLGRVLPELEAAVGDEGNLRAALSRIASENYAAAGDTVTAYFLYNRSLALPSGGEYASDYYDRIDYLDRPISDKVMVQIINLVEGERPGNKLLRTLLKDAKVDAHAVRDIAGTLALRKNNLKTALHHFSAIPKKWYDDNYEFSYNLGESPLSDDMVSPLPFTTKADVIRQLLVLEEMSAKGGDEGAIACLNLATAWYNMSGYGNAWMMLRYGKSGYEPDGPQKWPHSSGHKAVPHNQVDYDLSYKASRAQEYLDCAEATAKDPELLAQLSFMRARTNMAQAWREIQSLDLPDYSTKWDIIDSTRGAKYKELFSPMAKKYGETNYYNVLIRQCSSLEELGN